MAKNRKSRNPPVAAERNQPSDMPIAHKRTKGKKDVKVTRTPRPQPIFGEERRRLLASARPKHHNIGSTLDADNIPQTLLYTTTMEATPPSPKVVAAGAEVAGGSAAPPSAPADATPVTATPTAGLLPLGQVEGEAASSDSPPTGRGKKGRQGKRDRRSKSGSTTPVPTSGTNSDSDSAPRSEVQTILRDQEAEIERLKRKLEEAKKALLLLQTNILH